MTNVTFSLQRSQLSMPLRYKELAERLGTKLGSRAGLAETAQAVIELRTSKGMVLGTGGPDSRSAGSFFVNPVLDEVQMSELLKLAPDVPRFPAGRSRWSFGVQPERARSDSGVVEGAGGVVGRASRLCAGLPKGRRRHFKQAHFGVDSVRRG